MIRHQFKGHKYKAEPTVVDGIRFDSKKEADRYCELKLLRRAGNVAFFLRQTGWHLPGGTKYVSDFVVFYADGHVEVEDVKGYRTPEYLRKKRAVEKEYPIKITEI
jgi:hypothetical protein